MQKSENTEKKKCINAGIKGHKEHKNSKNIYHYTLTESDLTELDTV